MAFLFYVLSLKYLPEGPHTIVQKSTCCPRFYDTEVEMELPSLQCFSSTSSVELPWRLPASLYITVRAKPQTLFRSITNYCIFLTIVLNFYLRFSVSEKQTWWMEIKDNLLQCLLSCAERSSVIVIYSSCQEKSITDDIKMTYFAWATYCLNVHNLIERDF